MLFRKEKPTETFKEVHMKMLEKINDSKQSYQKSIEAEQEKLQHLTIEGANAKEKHLNTLSAKDLEALTDIEMEKIRVEKKISIMKDSLYHYSENAAIEMDYRAEMTTSLEKIEGALEKYLEAKNKLISLEDEALHAFDEYEGAIAYMNAHCENIPKNDRDIIRGLSGEYRSRMLKMIKNSISNKNRHRSIEGVLNVLHSLKSESDIERQFNEKMREKDLQNGKSPRKVIKDDSEW